MVFTKSSGRFVLMSMLGDHNSVQRFFTESHKITSEVQFITDSFPDAKTPAIKRIVHRLDAICTLLPNHNDPDTSERQKRPLIQWTDSLFLPIFMSFIDLQMLKEHRRLHRLRYTTDRGFIKN